MPVDNPAGLPIVGPVTPYITPAMLTAAPLGISWNSIPSPTATADQKLAEQLNICARATSMVDGYANQPLRATLDTEVFIGPGDFRCQNQPGSGVTRLLASRFPVLNVVSGQISASGSFPRQWQAIPANQFEPDVPLLGVYGSSAPSGSGEGGQGILLAPGWVTWAFGRNAWRVQVSYFNGWPHGALNQAAAVAATALSVDDITGWAGAAAVIYDTRGQEFVTVNSVTPNIPGSQIGPGTLNLAQPLTYAHAAGVLVSTLPAAVQQACMYFAVAQALTRGATATAVQATGGGATGGGPMTSDNYNQLAQGLIHAYKRRI